MAPHVAIYAATVSGRTITVQHQSGPADARPLASLVKLYVLYAVADAIDAGRLTWHTKLTLRDADKAAGSGSLIGRPAGARVSVREAATMMIHLSDNTATDLLIRTVGQAALARAVRDAGCSHPQLLSPFPTIKQDLWLEWSPDPDAVRARARYSHASRREQARLLRLADKEGTTAPDLSSATPQWQRGLGYLATASDIAKVTALLHLRAARPGLTPLRRILQAPDAGLRVPSAWHHTAFKGGTVAGVQTGSWYARMGHRDQLLVILASSAGGISPSGFEGLAGDAANVLASAG